MLVTSLSFLFFSVTRWMIHLQGFIMLHLVVLFYQTTTVLAGRQHTNEIIANIITNGGI